MYEVKIEIPFESAHRLMNHQGKCRHLHGHSYKAIISVRRKFLNDDSMVVDFAELKRSIGRWVDENWDHNALLDKRDPLFSIWRDPNDTTVLQSEVELSDSIFRGKRPFTLDKPPTAEVLAGYLLGLAWDFCHKHDPNTQVVSVSVRETDKCSAESFVHYPFHGIYPNESSTA